MKHTKNNVFHILLRVILDAKWLSILIFLAVSCAVVAALLPPLCLESIVNTLTQGTFPSWILIFTYFALNVLTKLLDAGRESLLTIFGQKMTCGLRHELCAKLSRLSTDVFVKQEPGVTASRFVGDVDTVEALFTSGIISMFADACKIISIFAILFVKNRGLAILLLLLFPPLYAMTRLFQKRMLASQLQNRAAIGRVSNHVPETIRCIRMVHTFRIEDYMRKKYDQYIEDSYAAVDRTNFYHALYSPIILVLNAFIVAAVMLLSATGNPTIQSFFGMSVGTAVAVIAYISQVFTPLESIGMEIQTIQSAMAGIHRIDEYLAQPERWDTEEGTYEPLPHSPSVQLDHVVFGYDSDSPILRDLSFTVQTGEQVTLSGRTGAGKSTLFKLLLGLYRPQSGQILIYGHNAALLPDSVKRSLFGYVEQSFHIVPGSVRDQITLFDPRISAEEAEEAAVTVGLAPVIRALPQGYDTPCTPTMFSQGQWQLLSIARAIAAQPNILLLDEITANLDSDTEQAVLAALRSASEHRTVLSISHRLYEQTGGRQIVIGASS